MGRKIRSALRIRGIEARTATVQEAERNDLEASALDLIAFGGGVEPALRKRLKEYFSARNPQAILLDVFAPVAVEQIDRALRGESGRGEFASDFAVVEHPDEFGIRLEVVRRCHVRIEVYHLGADLRGRVVEDREIPAGRFEVRMTENELDPGANMILAILAGREFYTWRIEVTK